MKTGYFPLSLSPCWNSSNDALRIACRCRARSRFRSWMRWRVWEMTVGTFPNRSTRASRTRSRPSSKAPCCNPCFNPSSLLSRSILVMYGILFTSSYFLISSRSRSSSGPLSCNTQSINSNKSRISCRLYFRSYNFRIRDHLTSYLWRGRRRSRSRFR